MTAAGPAGSPARDEDAIVCGHCALAPEVADALGTHGGGMCFGSLDAVARLLVEVARLRAENTELRGELRTARDQAAAMECDRDEAEAERDAAVAAVARLREAVTALHPHGVMPRQDGKPERHVCDTCTTDEGGWAPWPCPTIAALDPSPEVTG